MTFGALSLHMAQHIVLMNVVVPAAIFALARHLDLGRFWRSWPAASAAQLVLLWGWHSPPLIEAAMTDPAAMLAMTLSLMAVAAWFWLAIATMPQRDIWQAMIALLVTGKLFCLLGALLTFAPNLLFSMPGHHGHLAFTLADQSLAGTLMLVACPLTYVAVGIVLASRWVLSLDRQHG